VKPECSACRFSAVCATQGIRGVWDPLLREVHTRFQGKVHEKLTETHIKGTVEQLIRDWEYDTLPCYGGRVVVHGEPTGEAPHLEIKTTEGFL